jgi:hypothetical protein
MNTLETRKTDLENEVVKLQHLIQLKKSQIEMINEEMAILNNGNYTIQDNTIHTKQREVSEEEMINECDVNDKDDLLTLFNHTAVEMEYTKKSGEQVFRELTLNLELARDITSNPELEFYEDTTSSKGLSDEYIYVFDLNSEKMKKFIVKNFIQSFPINK